MSKRKIEENVEPEGSQRQRRRTRSLSEPRLSLPHQTEEPEKREALRRLFGRLIVLNAQNIQQQQEPEPAQVEDSDEDDLEDVIDENDDPLLDEVPVNMDPEQLGFFVCAQETLRFLHGRGFSVVHPTFVLLRNRLLEGIQQIAAA